MENLKFQCPRCPMKFTRRDSLEKHVKRLHQHETTAYECTTCGQTFNSLLLLRRHRHDHQNETGRFKLSESALRGNVKSYTMLHSIANPITEVMKVCSTYSSEIASLIFAGKVKNQN